mgnify:CR=1 FL=1
MAESTLTRHHRGPLTYVLRTFAIAYLFLLVAWPVSLVVTHTFTNGLDALHAVFGTPDLVAALKLSALAAVAATVINTVCAKVEIFDLAKGMEGPLLLFFFTISANLMA